MIQVQFYRCEYCHDTFEVEEECKQCEASHIVSNDIKQECCIYKYGMAYPEILELTFDDGKKLKYRAMFSQNVNNQPINPDAPQFMPNPDFNVTQTTLNPNQQTTIRSFNQPQ